MKQLRPKKKSIQGSKGHRSRVPARAELLQKELTEVVRHRTAISEVLRVIASSPHDWQPIFDTIIQSATRLCHATYGNLRLAEAQGFRLVAEVSYPSSVVWLSGGDSRPSIYHTALSLTWLQGSRPSTSRIWR
jgi:hypothetical protein